MPTLTLTDEQVVELIRQLSPERRRAVLLALAQTDPVQREARLEYAESQLRRLSSERGLDWDTMTEEERETFIDDLVHEERQCSK